MQQNLYNNKQYQNFILNNNNNMNSNNNNLTPQRQNQMTTPFGYNNNINLNNPITSSPNNSYNNQQQNQQKLSTPQIYMNPNIPYINGLTQLNTNSKDIVYSKENTQSEENVNNSNLNIFNNRPIDNQFMQGDMFLGIGSNPNNYIQKKYPQMGFGINNMLMPNFEQQNPQIFGMNNMNNINNINNNINNINNINNNNLNYSFQLNENIMNNNINKKIKNNNNGNKNQ